MTLRRRLARELAVLVAGVLLLGVAAVAGVRALHEDLGVAVHANAQLRDVYEVGAHVAIARARPDGGKEELQKAVARLDVVATSIGGTGSAAASLRESLLAAADGNAGIDEVYAKLIGLSSATTATVTALQHASDQRHREALLVVGVLAALTCAGVGIVGTRVYRAMMTPMGELREAVRRVAAGRLEERVPEEGDREFAALAGDFNRMAGELRSVYAELERRIEVKSRQLVQSERLASVGYLAAGVSHEINNPLAIIAGYAERATQKIDRDAAGADEYARKAFGVIAGEAFRCKQITQRLLQLARPGDPGRGVYRWKRWREVAALVGEMDRFAGKRVTVEADGEDLSVVGNEGELRQVALNLLVNALEAAPAEGGHAIVGVRAAGDGVQLVVADNGVGMTEETIARVFEPFYTEKRGGDRTPGTGLGLSVAHAIARAHGGTLTASSPGVNKGSVFTLRLTAARTN